MLHSRENPATETFGGGAEGWHAGGAADTDSTTDARDEVLQRLENIPAELREIDGWLLFELVPKPNGKRTRAGNPKYDKVPLQPRPPYRNASTANLGHVGTFEEAKHGFLNGSDADGLGFALTHAWMDAPDLIGIDADGVIDPETGKVYPDKQAVMDMLRTIGSYTEVSPSGEGLRAFCYSDELAGEFNNHDMGVEVYRAGGSPRFLTVTGTHLPGMPKALRRVEPEELEAALEPFRTRKTDTQDSGGTNLPKTPPARPEHVPAVDDLPVSKEFKAFLGDCGQVPEKYRTPEKPEGDRSPALLGATTAMLGAGIEPEVVHWVLMESDAYRVAEDHWKNNPDGYLWETVRKAAATVRGPAGPEEFPNMGDAPPNGDDWPELMPLDRGAPARLPIHQWPELLRDYATEAAAETETPVELPAMLALGVIATAVQRLVNVEIKPGYTEPVGIYIAVVLPPATRKSPELKRAQAPLVDWEKDRRALLESERKIAESKLKTHEARVSDIRRRAAKEKDEQAAQELEEQIAELELKAPTVPPQPRVFTSDVTTEHLATMMGENGESMAVIASEGGIFATMAGRYSSGVANIDLYLQAYSGDAVRVDRGSKPAVMLNSPRLTMLLTVQPNVIEEIAGKRELKGRGLIGRMLYAVPPSNLGTRTGEGERMRPATEAKYGTLVRELLDMASMTKTPPGKLPLSREARDAWYRFSQEIEAQLGSGGRFAHCTDWAGKIAGTTARIAALFHFARHGVEGVNPSISRQDMEAAIDTARALSTHALAVFDEMQLDQTTADAKAILRWWRGRAEHTGEADFTEREIHRSLQHRFPRASGLREPLAVLAERGYARRTEHKSAVGRTSRGVLFNPAALTVGAEGGNA